MVPPASDRVPPAPPYSGYCPGWQTLRVRGSHPLRPAFPCGFRCARFFPRGSPATPCAPRRPGFGLAPFRSPLLGGSLLFSFPPATWMFRFAGFAPACRGCRASRAAGFPIRASADPGLLAPPRGLSRPAAPFVASVSHRHPPCALLHSLAAPPHPCGIGRGPARSRLVRAPCAHAVSRVFSSLSLHLSLLGTHGDRPHARLDLPHPVNEPPPQSGASVEDVGLEPTTPGLQSLCSSRLSQSPMIAVVPGRLELPTPTLSVWCSNRLSYGTPTGGAPPASPSGRPLAGASHSL